MLEENRDQGMNINGLESRSAHKVIDLNPDVFVERPFSKDSAYPVNGNYAPMDEEDEETEEDLILGDEDEMDGDEEEYEIELDDDDIDDEDIDDDDLVIDTDDDDEDEDDEDLQKMTFENTS